MPDDGLLNAFQHCDPYNPKPVWQTFLGLFNAIDRGNDQLKIPRYNGGLFQPNATIDALAMPDHICEGFKRLAEYDFASEISVTVPAAARTDCAARSRQRAGQAVVADHFHHHGGQGKCKIERTITYNRSGWRKHRAA